MICVFYFFIFYYDIILRNNFSRSRKELELKLGRIRLSVSGKVYKSLGFGGISFGVVYYLCVFG